MNYQEQAHKHYKKAKKLEKQLTVPMTALELDRLEKRIKFHLDAFAEMIEAHARMIEAWAKRPYYTSTYPVTNSTITNASFTPSTSGWTVHGSTVTEAVKHTKDAFEDSFK
jgi:hypothetical protein